MSNTICPLILSAFSKKVCMNQGATLAFPMNYTM